jgi:hypothetical protein
MNDILRDRLLRKLDMLPEDKLNQVLDYMEFLDSKYAPRNAPAPNTLTRFAEGVESTLRAGKVSANAISGTMSIMNRAVGAINEVAAAGKSVATGILGAASGSGETPSQPVHPPAPPRGGPHELGSQLPHTPGDEPK